jgi:hypothetical protein
MQNRHPYLGIGVAVMGLLILCCVCPLILNSLLLILTFSATSPRDTISLYGSIFPQPAGGLSTSVYAIAMQYVCVSGLAIIVIVLGVLAFLQARKTA